MTAAGTPTAQGAQIAMQKAEQQSKEEVCLQQLASMGFTDSTECTLLLQQFSCDMAQVTDLLVASRQVGQTTNTELRHRVAALEMFLGIMALSLQSWVS